MVVGGALGPQVIGGVGVGLAGDGWYGIAVVVVFALALQFLCGGGRRAGAGSVVCPGGLGGRFDGFLAQFKRLGAVAFLEVDFRQRVQMLFK